MPLQVTCVKCGKEHKVKPELAGKRVKCTGCGAAIDVPAAPAESGKPADRIAVQCGGCGERMQAPASLAGKQVKCKKCGAAVAIPAAGQPAAARKAAAPKGAAAPVATVGDLLEDSKLGKLVAPKVLKPGETLCPNCNEVVPAGGLICVACGFDSRIGRQAGIERERTRSPGVQKAIDASIAFVIMIVAVAVAGGLAGGTTYMWMQNKAQWEQGWLPYRNLGISMAALGGACCILFNFSILADAFKEGWAQGLGFLLFSPYQLYYIATRWKTSRKAFFSLVIASYFFAVGFVIYRTAKVPEEENESSAPAVRAMEIARMEARIGLPA